jgi:uncharacterized protein
MVVVLDTNVLVSARAAGHAFHPILVAWLNKKLTLALSTEVLLEYEEVITERAGSERWDVLAKLLSLSPSVRLVSPTYRFRQITADADDNKFADCAIAAEADFIITQDRHFEAMVGSGYKPQPISPEAFLETHLPPLQPAKPTPS